ncbi:hypothetical protein BH160DRAFT_5383 [Burkholderia sp. H160]|nr:hypothetical protein BH160DRAFT_5383 [Burkholderia sp. H160]
MVAAEKSLHWVVDKWLAPTPSMPARVVRFCHRASQQQRYVCVQALNAEDCCRFSSSATTTARGTCSRRKPNGPR